MQRDSLVIDIFLQPGELYFGDRDTRIRTVLGSCVSITFWHPRLLIGGMCHYMLPERNSSEGERTPVSRRELDGRYADEAFALLAAEMHAAGTRMLEYETKLFGGGRMFDYPPAQAVLDIGTRNIEAGRNLLKRYARRPVSEHLAGFGHRNLIFDVASGTVWLRHLNEKLAAKEGSMGAAGDPHTGVGA